MGRDLARSIEHLPERLGSNLLCGPIIEPFSFWPVHHDGLYTKDCGMYHYVYGMAHIEYPLLLIKTLFVVIKK